jgi:hypothetical protein
MFFPRKNLANPLLCTHFGKNDVHRKFPKFCRYCLLFLLIFSLLRVIRLSQGAFSIFAE